MPESTVTDSRPSRKRAAIVGAVLLGTLPLWTLPLMGVASDGFLVYLWLSQTYYGGARRLFGATLFPLQEFGVIPNGPAGLLVGAAFYGAVGAAAGWVIAAALGTWRARRR